MSSSPNKAPDRGGWPFPAGFAIAWVIAILAIFVIGLFVLLG